MLKFVSVLLKLALSDLTHLKVFCFAPRAVLICRPTKFHGTLFKLFCLRPFMAGASTTTLIRFELSSLFRRKKHAFVDALLKHYFRSLLAPVDVLCESLIHRQQL